MNNIYLRKTTFNNLDMNQIETIKENEKMKLETTENNQRKIILNKSIK